MGLAHMTPDEVATAFAAPPPARRRIEIGQETAPVTVEVRGGVRIETRGQRCIGWRSSGHVSHG